MKEKVNQAQSESSLERFGYEESLNRVMGLPGVVFFGLAYLAPCGMFSTYGIVANMTHGMLALTYTIATGAMLLTALSYRQMVKAYPISGSVYTYVQRSINPHIGVLAGWAILLDYVLLPMFNLVAVGLYMNIFIPQIPSQVWILIFLVLVTVINLVGMRVTSMVNNIMILIQVAFLLGVIIFSIKYILGGGGAGSLLDLKSYFNSEEFASPEVGFAGILSGASILAMAFLGFDSVTTVVEETVEPEKNVGKALIITCLAAGCTFGITAYLMQAAWPEGWFSFADPDTGASDYFAHVIGDFMSSIFIGIVAVGGTASAIASQTSAARILFGMGRDGVLPKKVFGYVSKKAKVPAINILIISVITSSALILDLTAAASLVNFGALLGFVMVNVSVISHYFVRKKQRGVKATIIYLILPILGACVCLVIWANLDMMSKIVGGIWLLIGLIFLAITTKGFKQLPPEMNLTE